MFAASILIFISTLCNEFSFMDERRTGNEGQQMFTCAVATAMMVNAGYYMGFSVVGFVALLREVKGEGLME